MKKIASFITAFIIFVVIVAVFHFSIRGSLNVNNKAFGTWVNMYKDLSYEAVADNIGDDTMMVFGSSEFNHGKKTVYHPANLFKKQNVDLMLIGNAYNQSLTHAIKLGAVEKKIVNRKAVIVLSPTWFYTAGVKPANFDLRFSESDYMALMENSDISKKTKEYIAKRSEMLLDVDKPMQNRVKRYNDIYLEGKDGIWNRIFFNVRKSFISDKEMMTVKSAMKTSKIKYRNNRRKFKKASGLDFANLEKDALMNKTESRKNEFGMVDTIYNKKFKSRLNTALNSHMRDSFSKSPEYDDLKCFLDICKETNIDVMLVMQPLNGYWYDYTGLTVDKRQVFNSKIRQIADEYGVRVADFSNMEYSKSYFKDAVHPAGEGWVKINEKIYDFYKQS